MKTAILLAGLLLPVVVPSTKVVPPKKKTARAAPKARPRIVIDAGHGGNDDGALGRRTSDKIVALQVTLELKKLFDADKRIEVFYTRLRDRAVDLEARPAYARKLDADAFVSLHANSVDNKPWINGIEVWHLSDDRVGKGHQAAAAQSRSLAQLVERNLIWRTGQATRGVRQSGFKVLRASEIPSVLVELGFLSNATEESLLMNAGWQKKAARGIYDAVVQWMVQTGQLPKPKAPAKPAPKVHA